MLRRTIYYLILTLLATLSQVQAHSPDQHSKQPVPQTELAYTPSNIMRMKVPDLQLVDQDGEKGRFVSEFIGNRMAAVTFTYTTCSTACPILDGIFKQVQTRLGDRLGGDTILVTLSIDPVTDIPQRLKAHTEKIAARPGWSFLTGKKRTVNRILQSLEINTTDIFNHPPTVFIVDGQQGLYARVNGYPSSAKVIKELDRFHDARAQK